MKGYKIFVKHKKGNKHWQGPYYSQHNWVVEEGNILESRDFDPRIEEECGEGVNFWVEELYAYSHFRMECGNFPEVCMFRVRAIEEEEGDVIRPLRWGFWAKPRVDDPDSRSNKARAKKVKLLKRIKYYERKRRNT